MLRRRAVVLMILGLVGLALVSVVAIDHTTMLSIDPQRTTARVPIGRHERITFRVVNAHPWRDASIDFVKAQCGCFRVVEEPRIVPAGESREIVMDIYIDPRGDRVNNELRVYLPSGRKITAEVNADPIPPFEGWPQWAVPQRDDGTLRIALDPQYADMIVAAQVLTADGSPVETMLGDDAIVAIDPGEGARLRIVFEAEEGEVVWEGDCYQPPRAQPSP